MKYDLWRIAGLATAGFLLGLVASQPVLGLAAGLAVYVCLQIRGLRRLRDWLYSRDDQLPVLRGMLEEIVTEVGNLRKYHRQREEKLSQFLYRFQEATAELPDAIVILSQDGRIEWTNARAVEYLGIRWPQDADQRLANLIRYPGLQDLLDRGEQGEHADGVSLPSPEDAGRMLEYRVVPYGDRQRLLVARDVTQIHRINRMRRDFIANASHELRTPLTVIAGYLDAMDGDERVKAAGLDTQVRQMRKQTVRMQSLIEDLLMLSSLETEVQQRKDDIVAVPDILSNIHKEAKAVSGERNHIFSLEIRPDLYIRGSQNELYSAFSNLVMNAVQYTPPRGVITVRWYADDAGAHLQVTDTGEGIAPEHIPRLTERFYRVDRGRSRDSGGTGLGLAIVKHVLSRHQAQLHIESEPGRGSTFRCDFKPDRIVIQRPGDTAHSSS